MTAPQPPILGESICPLAPNSGGTGMESPPELGDLGGKSIVPIATDRSLRIAT